MANKESNVVLNFKMDGQIEYAKTITDINAIMNAAASEYRTHVAAMDKDADATERLAAEKKKLEIQLEAGQERTKKLRAEYEAMSKDTRTTTNQLANKYRQLQNSERAEIALSGALERVNEELTEQAQESREAEKALNKLETEKESLEQQTKKLNAEYELQKTRLGENATEAEKLSLKAEHLNKQHEIASENVRNHERQLQEAKKAYGENSTEVDKYEIELLEAKRAEQELANEIKATNKELIEQHDTLEKARKKLEETGQAMTDIGKDWTMKVTAPIVGAGTGMVMAANKVDDGLAIIRKSTGATGEEFEEFERTFKNVFSESSNSAEEVAEVMSSLNTATDQTGEALEELTMKTLDYARVNNEDAVDSANTLGRLMNALEADVSEMPRVMDKLTRASQMSGIEVNQLSEYIIDAGPAFEEMGFDLERSIGLFANFQKVGAEPREVLSSLNIVLNRLSQEAVEASNASDRLAEAQLKLDDASLKVKERTEALAKAKENDGENSLKAQRAAMELEKAQSTLAKEQENFNEIQKQMSKGTLSAEEAFNELLQDIKDAPDILAATTIASEAFGARVGSKVAEDIRDGHFEVDEWVEALKTAEGTMQEAADESETFGDKLENLRNRVTVAFEPFGSSIIDSLQDLIVAAVPVLDKVAEMAEGFSNLDPTVQTTIISFIGAVATLGPFIAALGSVINGLSKMLGVGKTVISWGARLLPLFKAVGAAIAGISAPVWAVIAAIAALVAGGIALWNNWDTVKEKASLFWTFLVEGFTNLKDTIVEFFTVTIPEKFNEFVSFIQELPEKVMEFLSKLFKEDIPDAIGYGIGYMILKAHEGYEKTVEFFQKLPGRVLEFLTQTIERITNFASDAKDKAIETGSNFLTSIIDYVKKLPGRMWSNLTDAITRMSNFASDMKDKAVDTGKNVYNSIVDEVKKIPGRLKNLGSDIITGLTDGVRNSIKKVGNVAKDMASNFVDGFKRAMGIKSPSIIMRELGQFLTTGLGLGIEDEAGFAVDKTVNVAKSITGAVEEGIKLPNLEMGTVVRQPNINQQTLGSGLTMSTLNNIGTSIRESLSNLSGTINVNVFLDSEQLNTKLAPGMSKQINKNNKFDARSKGVITV